MIVLRAEFDRITESFPKRDLVFRFVFISEEPIGWSFSAARVVLYYCSTSSCVNSSVANEIRYTKCGWILKKPVPWLRAESSL